MIDCKEVIIKQNENSTTYKVELNGCKIISNGEKIDANLVFPKVLKTENGFILGDASKESEIFTIYILD